MERRDAISLAAMRGRFTVQPRADPMEGPGPKHIDRQDQHPGATDIGCESVWRQVIHGTTFLVLFATRLL
jgi:hypothetical protein